MSADPHLEALSNLSTALSRVVASTSSSIVTVESRRSRSSGFVWKPGLIITADEALSEEGEVTVVLPGGQKAAASIAGRDPASDVVLLRAETGGAAPLNLHESVPPAGALAIGVGGANGTPSAAFGIVSVSGPAWHSLRGGEISARIELDLMLSRASEGGVALDAEARAFGMTVFGPHRRVLVIPSATILAVATKLETQGKVPRGYLGLGLQPVRLDGSDDFGAMVISVVADGPAARAGLHQGDVIAAWDGKPLVSWPALMRSVRMAGAGTTVSLTIRRSGETRDVTLVTGERP